jgi:hypothetical protein
MMTPRLAIPAVAFGHGGSIEAAVGVCARPAVFVAVRGCEARKRLRDNPIPG